MIDVEKNDASFLNASVMERFSIKHEMPQVTIVRHTSPHDAAQGSIYSDNFVLIFVEDLNKPVMNAIRYASLLAGEIVAIHIQINLEDKERIGDRWKKLGVEIPLVVLDSTNGSVIQSLTAFIDRMCRQKQGFVTMVLPVLAGLKWWQRFLHNHTACLIEKALRRREGVITVRVPFPLSGDLS